MTRSSIVLAMLAHNEARYLQTIRDNLGSRIDAVVIVSNPPNDDGTVEVAKEIFKDFEGEVVELPWPDDLFAGARNNVFNLARKYNKDYILWCDPDSPIVGIIPDELTAAMYAMYTVDVPSGISWVVPHLIRSDLNIHWKGKVHEYLDIGSVTLPMQLLTSCKVIRSAPGGTPSRIREWDLKVLTEEVKKDRKDQRSSFYLAQTWRDLGETENAINEYKRCSTLPGFDQMTFYAMYMVGCLYMGQDNVKAKDWLLRAFAFRPTRVEPMNRLHELSNLIGEYREAYQYLKNAIAIPPSTDSVLVEKRIGE